MDTEASSETAQEIGQAIQAWLDDDKSDPNWKLLDWLRGFSLPALADAEPYPWLIQGLEATGDRNQTSGKFCDRVKGFLETRPDIRLEGYWPDRALYNLFMLCACLHCPSCLAEPLQVIFRDQTVKGTWRGLDLRASLRRALIENQVDDALKDEWLAMIRGVHPYLPGDQLDGFSGLVKMHSTPNRIDEPAVGAIVEGLNCLIEVDSEDTPYLFTEMINCIFRCRPDDLVPISLAWASSISGPAFRDRQWRGTVLNVAGYWFDKIATSEARKSGHESVEEARLGGVQSVIDLMAAKKKMNSGTVLV